MALKDFIEIQIATIEESNALCVDRRNRTKSKKITEVIDRTLKDNARDLRNLKRDLAKVS